MSHDPLSRGYEPRDPFQQYHGQPEAERQRMYGQQRTDPYAGAIAGGSPWANECVPKLRKDGTVTMEMAEMEKILDAMTVAIDIMSNKLSPVIIPAPEQAPGLRGNGPMGGSDLAMELARRNARLRDHLTRLELLHQGIDL